MNATLIKALALLAVAGALFAFTAFRYSKSKTRASLLQLTGIVCWMVVALAHLCEGLALLPAMGWGRQGSAGHYLDLGSAVLGIGLISAGLALQMATRRRG